MGVTWCLRKGDGVRVGDMDLIVGSVYVSPLDNRKYATINSQGDPVRLDKYGMTYCIGQEIRISISPNQPESSSSKIRLLFDVPRNIPMSKIKRKSNV